jgi:hypothetical protein
MLFEIQKMKFKIGGNSMPQDPVKTMTSLDPSRP